MVHAPQRKGSENRVGWVLRIDEIYEWLDPTDNFLPLFQVFRRLTQRNQPISPSETFCHSRRPEPPDLLCVPRILLSSLWDRLESKARREPWLAPLYPADGD